MITITKIIKIPENRCIHLDLELPQTIPPGQANLQINISPVYSVSLLELIKRHGGKLKDSAAFTGNSVEIVRRIRDGE
jgi:hypothetical protein